MSKFKIIIIWLTLFSFAGTTFLSFPIPAITILDEEKLSEKFMREANRQFTFIEDPVVVDYVQSMGKRIGTHLPPHPYKFRFFIIQKDGYNAFAGPGGVIFIFSDLLAAMESPDELAGIMTHEMIHVTSRHISDRIDRSKQIGIVTLAGLVAAIALGAAGEGSAASAMVVGSMATGQSMFLAYSREDEMQADQLGLKILTRAGYSPRGLVRIMDKIRQEQWYGTKEVPTYLRTHPASEERIAYIASWIERQNNLPKRPSKQEQIDFDWVRTRVKALYGKKEQEMAIFSQHLNKKPEDPFLNYGYGLLLARSGRYAEAADYLKKTLAKRAFDPQVLVDLGGVYFKGGHLAQSIEALNGALTIAPDNADGLYFLGQAYLAHKKPSEAVEAFEKLAKKHPQYRDLAYFSSQAYGQTGKMAMAHYHLGRYHYQKGKINQAIGQLEKALALVKESDLKTEVTVLLKKVRAERTDQRNKPS